MPTLNERNLCCVKCGYDLYGLNEDSACPECGTRISWTRNQLRARRSKARSRYFYTKRLCAIAPCLYVIWVIYALVAGGKGGAFLALYALYPLRIIFQSVGINSLGAAGGLIMFYIGGPLFYAGVGASVGFAIDVIIKRLHRVA